MYREECDAGVDAPGSGGDCGAGEEVRGGGVYVWEGGGAVERDINRNIIISIFRPISHIMILMLLRDNNLEFIREFNNECLIKGEFDWIFKF